MRAFIAIPLPKELWGKVAKLQEKIDMLDVDIKFVEPENLHYNLKFLGEINLNEVEKIKVIMDEIAQEFEPFRLHVAGLGSFPSAQYIRVIWVGVKDGVQQIRALAEQLEYRLVQAGFRREEKQFTPHLTIGRVRSSRNKPELIVLLKELKDIDIGSFEVNGFTLFESKLSPKGPEYNPIHEARFV